MVIEKYSDKNSLKISIFSKVVVGGRKVVVHQSAKEKGVRIFLRTPFSLFVIIVLLRSQMHYLKSCSFLPM